MGTLTGVYLPTIQNILGVLLYLRLAWIVGNAGVGQTLLIVFICCTATLLTAVSMSAIATNGVVPAGGAYFMISRNLGPEFGGAVGILFYLGTTFASSMYVLGAIELLLTYMAPGMSAFGDAAPGSDAMLSNMRLYGTVLLLLLGFIVFVGVKYVNRFANVCLVAVLVSIFLIYIGFFASPEARQPDVCLIDGNLINSGYEGNCSVADLDRNLSYDFLTVNSTFERLRAFPGLGSGQMHANVHSNYLGKGETQPGVPGEKPQVVADATASFTVLLAIFFPACTGIMAGSNRSGDLRDASRSIPVGTIAAILTTTFIYITMVLFLGGAVLGPVLRDKFGDSISGSNVIAEVSWPHPMLILIGAALSTIGAGLQSLMGAPRLLQAIAQDSILPFLSIFGKASASGEPTRALILTVFISWIGVMIASLDSVAPLVTQFFLLCYGFVNLACSLQSLLKSPSWRPRFKYYHWGLSSFGLLLCILLMFISSWYYAFVATFLAVMVYYYIEFKGAAKEWGDGIRGLSMQAARYSLLRLEEATISTHTKNWRPQLLTLIKLHPETLDVDEPRLIALAGHLKGGKGLNMVGSVLPGDFKIRMADKFTGEVAIKAALKSHMVQGFAEVIISQDVAQGISYLMQGAGLGALQHNSVLLGWPESWRSAMDSNTASESDMLTSMQQVTLFFETLSICSLQQHAIIVPKNLHLFPTMEEKQAGTIDVWWILHEGGLLLLLGYLLQHDPVWRKCRLRVFTVAENDDNTIQMERDLQTFLYHLRIDADVRVVEMLDSDIAAYTVERTRRMEDRRSLLHKLQLTRRQQKHVLEQAVPTQTEKPPGQDGPSFANENVRMMNTSVKLNRMLMEHSKNASLVLINLPDVPVTGAEDLDKATDYLEFVEVLTENLQRVLLVRGGGREVVTIFS
ncbi:uncharacterized protein MONBRDRAFT_6305 [Monosiga brevicollis MX1]|uniref:Amino acid permease/ SLC12A domain-containing protein n=1 Tax=Monosiga brevicollis TaxID=81824 RepID=A9UTF7_MONBE|nr:uncharacterized protein MONBRDRAFT_6305 [Monosiga brevicollis MX1]EDQ91239.1 predicted protein [Monosiga brevicollis MX1]|eukprot:XP_001743661.1 hypothetical protein [Monosiga brevicollis MX1]